MKSTRFRQNRVSAQRCMLLQAAWLMHGGRL